jgi:hypothetical protein
VQKWTKVDKEEVKKRREGARLWQFEQKNTSSTRNTERAPATAEPASIDAKHVRDAAVMMMKAHGYHETQGRSG